MATASADARALQGRGAIALGSGWLRFTFAREPLGRDRKPQLQITIPAAIARLMLESSNAWSWKLTDEGVLLEPATEDDPSELPAWAKKRDARSAKRTRRP